jgi:hypothetical protein
VSPTAGVLSEAWQVYKQHWRHLLPIAFIVFAVLAVITALLDAVLADWAAGIIGSILGIVGTYWLQGALVKAVEDVRDGRADLSMGETFAAVWPRVGGIIVASILAAIGVLLGLILLIIPGLVLMTWWVVIIPVIVLENASAGASFGRSRELVRGYGWNVFGVIVLTILVLIAAGIVLGIILSPLNDWLEGFVSNIVSGTLIAPFVAVAWTLLYYRLREAKARTASEPAESLA